MKFYNYDYTVAPCRCDDCEKRRPKREYTEEDYRRMAERKAKNIKALNAQRQNSFYEARYKGE